MVDLTFLEGSVVTYMKLPEVRVLGQRIVQAVSRFCWTGGFLKVFFSIFDVSVLLQ